MNVLGFVLAAVLLALLGHFLYKRLPKQRQRREIRALLLRCAGDQSLVERLIFAEMQRDESLDFADAARRARLRLERDQG